MAEEVREGKKAPGFALPDPSGQKVKLSDFAGKKVVLYFYPKDDTPGCTTEACGFREAHDGITAKNAVVLGVSPDPAKSHEAFIKKFGLPFTLLSDGDHKVAETYGAWGEKTMYGKKTMGILRSTFLIDERGKIFRVFRKVKPEGHAEEVLAAM
jgi:peroxiredoxin Q/BCP